MNGRETIKLRETDLKRLIKRVISESQLLTEEVHCHEGTAGTACHGGRIWCEVASSHQTEPGCYCRPAHWCNQHGCNPECSPEGTTGPAYPEGDNPLDPKQIGGGSGFVNPQRGSDRLTTFNNRNRQIGESDLRRLIKGVMVEEKKQKECWVCKNWWVERPGRFHCEEQQRSSDGKCDGGYKSADKCRRKCGGRKNIPISDIGITKLDGTFISGEELDGGKTPTTENIKRVIKSVITEQSPPQICPPGTMGLKVTPCPGTTYHGGAPMPYGPWYSTCATLNGQIPTQANIGDIITSLTNTSGTIKYEILDLLHRNPSNPIQNYASSTCPTPTPTVGCDISAWSNHSNWVNTWTNSGPFNSQNQNQPCNHICKQINTWTNKLTNAGTTQVNQLNCKIDEGNNQSQIHGCNC